MMNLSNNILYLIPMYVLNVEKQSKDLSKIKNLIVLWQK